MNQNISDLRQWREDAQPEQQLTPPHTHTIEKNDKLNRTRHTRESVAAHRSNGREGRSDGTGRERGIKKIGEGIGAGRRVRRGD